MAVAVLATFDAADGWMLFSIGVLLVVLAFLAVAEMGLSRITRPKAHALADSGAHGGGALVRLVNHPERFVNSVLLLVNVCQTVQATLTGIVAARLFGVIGVVVGVTLNVVVFFVIAESVPKTWAVLHPDRAALLLARPVSALVAFPPLRLVSRGLIGLANVIIPGKGLKQGPFVGEQEFLATVQAAAADEVIESEERELIESVIEFGDTVAREVMVPRPDMITVASTLSVSEALDLSIEQGYSRLPVEGENRDDVIGLVFAKDLMRAERAGQGGQRVTTVTRPAMFVPETKPLSRLMREMQTTKQHMAVLIDEYGGVAGLVTLEDCLEELVGDIVDEYDVELPEVERLATGELRVDASIAIGELSELIGEELPDEDWDTVGGFVLAMLGHVPEVGEVAQFDGWSFTVEAMEARRVARVLASRVPGWQPPGDDEEDVADHA